MTLGDAKGYGSRPNLTSGTVYARVHMCQSYFFESVST